MRFLVATIAIVFAFPAAAQDWWQAETNNFIIKSRDSRANTERFARELERFDMALRTLQNLPVGEEQESRSTKLTIYRFGYTADIGRLAGAQGVAGFFIPNAGANVGFVPVQERRRSGNFGAIDPDRRTREAMAMDPQLVLHHEYIHYFMMQHFPSAYPRWYVEGFAELMATIRLNDDGSFHVGDPPQYRAYQVFQMSQFRLEDMLDSKHELRGYEGYQHYATGWLLAHYLSFDPERHQQLRAYLIALGQGEDSLQAARRIFGDLRAMDRELLRYRRGPFPGYDVKPENYVEPAVELRALTASEQALMRQEMRLRRGAFNKRERRNIASDIRSAAAAYPDDPHAIELLAAAELQAKNFDAANEAAHRLTEIAPGDVDGWLILATAAIERSKEEPSWASRARDYAITAQQIDQADPRPLIAYYSSFVASGEEPTETAILALEQAFGMAGTDSRYRVLLARQLLIEDQIEAAKGVLQPIAFRGHNHGDPDDDKDDKDRPTLDKVMNLVNVDDREGSIAMIDRLLDWDPVDDEA